MKRAKNLTAPKRRITLKHREQRNRHRGCVLWFTGLSASGKSSIASELEAALFARGHQTFVLDGDCLRHGLCSDLGFSPADRTENIRRVGEVASLFAQAGLICIAAFISPYRADRDLVRRQSDGRFYEIYVNAPLAVCEARDPKGLYRQARARKIRNFTGISAPYEAPLKPDLELPTDQLTVPQSVETILRHLKKWRIVTW